MTFSVPSVRFPSQIAMLATEFLMRREFKIGYARLIDAKADTVGGGTFTALAWQTRVLNTESYDTGNFVSLPGSNTFLLLPGIYVIEWFCPALQVNSNQSRLFDVTANAATGDYGSSERSGSGDGTQTTSYGSAKIVSDNTTYRIEHWCVTTANTTGFGFPASAGVGEVYTQVNIVKLA